MKIGIVEFDYHPEVLRNIVLLLQESEHKVTIFTTEKIWNNVGLYDSNDDLPSHFKLYAKSEKEAYKSYIVKHLENINTNNILIFNTIASNFKIFNSLKLKPTIVVTVHNSNTFFNKGFNYTPILSPFYLWKDFSHIIRKSIIEIDWYHRNQFLKKVNYFTFPNTPISEYAIANNFVSKDKIILPPLPMTFYKGRESLKEAIDVVKITVIGTIDKRRRDYDLLFKAFEKITTQSNTSIELTLLGKSASKYSKRIINKFDKLSSNTFKLTTFDSFVEQDLFNKVIDTTDFLIVPLKLETRYTIYNETYGKTKVSGNENDMIKWGIPSIFPKNYSISERILKMCAFYDSSTDLANIVIEWVNNKKFAQIKPDEYLNEFNLNRSRAEFNSTIHSL
jgi:hypothetical protein